MKDVADDLRIEAVVPCRWLGRVGPSCRLPWSGRSSGGLQKLATTPEPPPPLSEPSLSNSYARPADAGWDYKQPKELSPQLRELLMHYGQLSQVCVPFLRRGRLCAKGAPPCLRTAPTHPPL